MKVIDLTESFIEDALENGDQNTYHARFPELFDHYYSHWCSRSAYATKLTPQLLRRNTQRIRSLLPGIAERFAKIGLDTQELTLALIVGQQTSNGHAFEFQGEFVAWLAVETYTSDLLARVFIPHELAHALHFSETPDFFFRSHHEQHLVSRQLACEGLATLVSQAICQTDDLTALWADYLPRTTTEGWLKRCEQSWDELAIHTINDFDRSTPDNGMFVFREISDIFQSRAGYYVGLRAVRDVQYTQDLSLIDLLKLERSRFEELLRNSLASQRN